MQVRVPGYPQPLDINVGGPPNVMQISGTIAGLGTLVFPNTIAAGATFESGVLKTGGMNHFALSGTLSQTGSLEVLPFADQNGLNPTGTVASSALVAGTGLTLDVNFGQIVQSVQVKIVNTGGTAGTLTNPTFAISA